MNSGCVVGTPSQARSRAKRGSGPRFRLARQLARAPWMRHAIRHAITWGSILASEILVKSSIAVEFMAN